MIYKKKLMILMLIEEDKKANDKDDIKEDDIKEHESEDGRTNLFHQIVTSLPSNKL